jgi:hypothetical protein
MALSFLDEIAMNAKRRTEASRYAISLAELRWQGGESAVDVGLNVGARAAWRRCYAQCED